MEDTQSRSVWAFVDQGSGPLKVAAKSIEAMSAKMTKAERASASMSRQIGGDAGNVAASMEREQKKQERLAQQKAVADRRLGLMQLEAGEMNKTFDEQKKGPAPKQLSESQEIRAEAMARRLRTRGLKLEEQQGQIAEGAMATFAKTLHAEGGPLGEALTMLGEHSQNIGFQMSAFGGKMGETGTKLVQMGGKIGMLGAAFAIGYTAMTALDEHFHGAITDFVSGEESGRKIQANQEAFAKASGFATIELYRSATEMGAKLQKDMELRNRTEEAAKKLGAMPLDKTSEAMRLWESQLTALIGKTAVAGDDLTKMASIMREAAGKTSRSWEQGANAQIDLVAATKKYSKSVLAVALNPDASDEEKKRQKYNIRTLTDIAIADKAISAEKASEFAAGLEAEIERRGSVEASTRTLWASTEEQDKVDQALKQLKMPAYKASSSLIALHKTVIERAEELGESKGFTPEMSAELAKKALNKFDMAKSKVNIDFRNSKFDIKQAFAEGFDPDRIAVAFTNDLAMLGERRLQSGLAPINAARVSGG